MQPIDTRVRDVELTISQVGAFADSPFQGNPAAACPLDAWLGDERLQAIAEESNLSEAAFVVGCDSGYRLRWFTPQAEVDPCGHATLATAWVLIHKLDDASSVLRFTTRSGELGVWRESDSLAMGFPVKRPEPCAIPDGLLEALGIAETEVLEIDDYLVVVDDEKTIAALAPDFVRPKGLPCRGVAVTVRSQHFDFVSRWFGPNIGVNENPVTDFMHISLAPYWAQRLGRTRLSAEQGGAYKGRLECGMCGERVVISGKVALYMNGTLHL